MLCIVPLLIATISSSAMDILENAGGKLMHFQPEVDQFLIAAGVLHEDEIEVVQKVHENDHHTQTTTAQDLEMIDNSAVSENPSSDRITLEVNEKLLSGEPEESQSYHLMVRWLDSAQGKYPVLYRSIENESGSALEKVWEPLERLRGHIPHKYRDKYRRPKSVAKLKRASRTHKIIKQ